MSPRTILVLAALLLAFVVGCTSDTEPVHEEPAGETTSDLRWQPTDHHPDDIEEAGVPRVVLRDDRLHLNLPYLPPFSVTQLSLGDGVLEVIIEFEDEERYHDPWSCPENAVSIAVEGIDRGEVQDIRVIDTLGRLLDLGISLQEAVRRVEQFIEADFGLPTGWCLQLADDPESPPVTYYLDYADDQVIDHGGTTAVSGWFRVCAATGDIVDCSVRRVPMAGRAFLNDASFLSWTPEGHMLVLKERDLLLFDTDGRIELELPGSVPGEDLTFTLLEENRAHFTLDGRECIAVCLDTGALVESSCPDPPTPPETSPMMRQRVLAAR